MPLLAFCEWLANTPWSIALHESQYAYILIESVHVLALCVFLGLAMMLDLRLLGLTLRRVPLSDMTERLLPWMTAGFVVMVISGALLFYAIPVRSYQNIFFRAKMLFLLLAGANAWIFHSGEYRRVGEWDLDPIPPRKARLAGGVSLVLWIAIVFAGRMIAYNWFDCAQPQSALIMFAAGCTDQK